MPLSYTNLCRCFKVPFSALYEPDLAALKQALVSRGLNNRGWRLCLDYGDDLFMPLGGVWLRSNDEISARNIMAFLKLLQGAETDMPPPRDFTASMVSWRIPDWNLSLVPVHFFRAAWKACMAADYAGRETFIDRELIPVSRWFFTTGQYKLLYDNVYKAGWKSILYRWRRALISQGELDPFSEWNPVIRWAETGAFRFLALDSEEALQIESEAMSNCVHSYGSQCKSDTLKVFSVRKRRTNERIATLSVKEVRKGEWTIGQIKGPKNAEVSEYTIREATALLRCLDEATCEIEDLRRFMAGVFVTARQTRISKAFLEDYDECF